MPDTITKILFRRGLDIVRRVGGGDGVKFHIGEPAFCIDTKRLYVGTGDDAFGDTGGVPIGTKCHGNVSLFGSAGPGYTSTAINTMTANGIDVGDLICDNVNNVLYYVTSKNPMSAVPAPSELTRFNLLSMVSGDNGITSTKTYEVVTNKLNYDFFDVNYSTGITFKYPTTVANTLTVNSNGSFGANIDVTGTATIHSTTLCYGNITSNGIIYSNGGGVGRSSNDWYNSFSNVNSNSATWNNAATTLTGLLPMGWQYRTTGTQYISTYGSNSYRVGINTAPTLVGLTIKGSSTLATALSVQGSIEATGDVIVYTTSDIKFKKNISAIKNPLTKVMQINGITFDWDCDHKQGRDVGVIAQEIERVIPEAVIDRGDAGKAVNYEKIIPLLIEAIKELANTKYGR